MRDAEHRDLGAARDIAQQLRYKESLKEQEIGMPSRPHLSALAAEHGIEQFTGAAGSALMFDCNSTHGSGSNIITPFARSNIFLVFNSVENALGEPFAAAKPDRTSSRHATSLPLAKADLV